MVPLVDNVKTLVVSVLQTRSTDFTSHQLTMQDSQYVLLVIGGRAEGPEKCSVPFYTEIFLRQALLLPTALTPKSGILSWKKRALEADLLPHRNRGTDNIVHSHAEITQSVPGQRPKGLHWCGRC